MAREAATTTVTEAQRRHGLRGDLAGGLTQGRPEPVFNRVHESSLSMRPRDESARWVADLTLLGPIPMTAAISSGERSR